jgi:hypothetical protein
LTTTGSTVTKVKVDPDLLPLDEIGAVRWTVSGVFAGTTNSAGGATTGGATEAGPAPDGRAVVAAPAGADVNAGWTGTEVTAAEPSANASDGRHSTAMAPARRL